MDELKFIMYKDRAKIVAEELGNDVVIEHYDDDADTVIFKKVNGIMLLLLFHAGVRSGHDGLKNALNIMG
jgi:hypothetical protein